MLKKLALFVFAAVLFAIGCKDDDNTTPTVTVPMTFEVQYEGQRLFKNTWYNFDTLKFQVEAFTFYVSDITLIDQDGREKVVSDIDFLDFTPDNTPTNESVTASVSLLNVPEGVYTRIKVGFGVKPSLNAKDPSDFPVGHPLYREFDYWSGWNSYIFTRIDGKLDRTGDQVSDVSLVYHCGSDAVYKTYTFDAPSASFSRPFEAGKDGGLNVRIELKELFLLDSGQPYDIAAHPATSNDVTEVTVATVIQGHFQRAFKAIPY